MGDLQTNIDVRYKKRNKENGRFEKTHGGTNTRLFEIWRKMRARCDKENLKIYENYGGRGITYCEEWKQFENFRDWALSNGYSDDLSIDRIDNNGNYEPSNCRWADAYTQANNTRQNRLYEYQGQIKTISQWAREKGIKYVTLRKRLDKGWDIERAMTEKVVIGKNKHWYKNQENLEVEQMKEDREKAKKGFY